jgi:hypothetical protein
MPDPGPILRGIAEALTPALASLFKTAALMLLLAVLLAVGAYLIASDGSILRGLLAVLIAFAACAAFGIPLSWKRAIFAGVLATARRQRVGSYLVTSVFDRLLGVSSEGEAGARGGRVVQSIERVPLNQAASKLRMAVIHQVRAAPQGGGLSGFLKRKIEAVLLSYIETFTLARFRDDAAAHGGIDLIKVRDELATTADNLIAERIEEAMLKLTILLMAGAALVSIGAAFGVKQIPI